jgi:hypothetical protein
MRDLSRSLLSRLQKLARRQPPAPGVSFWDVILATAPDDLDDASKARWEEFHRSHEDDPNPVSQQIAEMLKELPNNNGEQP